MDINEEKTKIMERYGLSQADVDSIVSDEPIPNTIQSFVSKESIHELKEIQASLQSISNLTDEGIRLKCLELAAKDATNMGDKQIVAAAQSYYDWIKGN